MVLTDRQRQDLHAGIYEYLLSQKGEAFAKVAEALKEADPSACAKHDSKKTSTATTTPTKSGSAPILEKKWTAVSRLQKKILDLERSMAQSARIHAHRTSSTSMNGSGADFSSGAAGGGGGGPRRMLPRPPCVHTLEGHSGVVNSVAVHPIWTVAISGSDDGTIKVWDHESGDYIRTLKGHTNSVNCVTFTPTGTHLASCSTDLSIKIWDTSTYKCLRTLRGHDHTISFIRFIPLVSSSTTDSINNNDSNSGSFRNTSGSIMDAAVAGTSHVVSASRDRTVKFWDVQTGFCDHTLNDHHDWVRCLAVRQDDGSLLATAGSDQNIFVYNTQTKGKVCELRGHEHVIESVAFLTISSSTKSAASANNTDAKDYLASGGRDRTVRLWSISSVSCLAKFEYHENWVRSVLIHPSGNYILSSSDDRTIRVFDIKSNRCLRTIDDAHSHFISSIDMHHTLPILVSGGVDQTVRCWLLD